MHDSARLISDFPLQFNAAVDLMAHNLAQRPEKAALIDHHGACSYAALSDRIDRMADLLQRLGVVPGDRVLLCLLDTRDFPTVFLGAIKAGVIPVPLNTLLTSEDYRWIVENSEARAAFVSAELAPNWLNIADQTPSLCFVSSEGGPWADLEVLLDEATPQVSAANTKRDDVAFWLYTSGSTGRPKGAMHTHASLRLTANLFGSGVLGISDTDIVYSVAKQFFGYGLGNALTFPYAVGATAVLLKERATPEAVSDVLKRHKVTIVGGVPTFYASWFGSASLPAAQQVPSLRLALSAGEALPQHLGEAFKRHFDVDVIDGLGSTEMLHIFVAQRPGAVKYGCTGKPVDGYHVRIVDENGRDAAVGEVGDLHVQGPTCATAYWKNPEKSAATFRDGWTITGDKYVADADGWLTYAGRGDDMLKVGGIYVSPIEVEEVLASHPDVLEAAVVGAADAAGLIKPRGHVVLRTGLQGDSSMEAALKDYVKSRLAPYKYPRWIVFEPELPKTATGKIQRFRLRDV